MVISTSKEKRSNFQMKHDDLIKKLEELISSISNRKSQSADFFLNIKNSLHDDYKNVYKLDSLIKCYAITQYANFSKNEEDILNQAIDLARDLRNEITKPI